MFFLICAIIGGICFAIWFFFHDQLTLLVKWIRIGEIYMVRLIYGPNFMIADDVQNEYMKIWINWLPKATPADFPPYLIKRSTLIAVVPLRLLFLAIMGMMTVFVIFRGPGTQYKRRMSLEMLMAEQAKSFPAIGPFLKFDPRKLPFRAPGQPVPAQLPMFSEQLSPEEWLAYHEIKWSGSQLDYNKAYQALALQLGQRWQGPDKLPIHGQCLYAACALKVVRKRKDCEEMLNMMADSWTPEKGFRPSAKLKAKVRAVIKNPKTGGVLQKFADMHAFETTALLRCLMRAREEGGVLAPAEFLWLRGHDRTLWYPLNNLGRKSYSPEAAGALVHLTNELIAGQKIPTPRFDEVIRGLETYMKSPSARAIPEIERKGKGG